VRDYVSKGTQLFIQGKIQTRSWDDKESGQKRYWTEIFVHDLTLLGGGRGENGGSTHSNGRDDSRRTLVDQATSGSRWTSSTPTKN
jgi:single-strand DNA-binding protein